MPGAFERTSGMTANVSRTTDNQNDHRLNSFPTLQLAGRRSNPQLYGCTGETNHHRKYQTVGVARVVARACIPAPAKSRAQSALQAPDDDVNSPSFWHRTRDVDLAVTPYSK